MKFILILWLALASLAHAEPVSAEDQAAARALVKQLYDAYKARDLKQVMSLIQPAVERSALDYEASGKGQAQEIRDAFLAFHEDLLNHPQYRLHDYNDQFIVFEPGQNGEFVLASSVPVIQTDVLDFQSSDGSSSTTARLRLGRFTLKKADGTLQIVQMDL